MYIYKFSNLRKLYGRPEPNYDSEEELVTALTDLEAMDEASNQNLSEDSASPSETIGEVQEPEYLTAELMTEILVNASQETRTRNRLPIFRTDEICAEFIDALVCYSQLVDPADSTGLFENNQSVGPGPERKTWYYLIKVGSTDYFRKMRAQVRKSFADKLKSVMRKSLRYKSPLSKVGWILGFWLCRLYEAQRDMYDIPAVLLQTRQFFLSKFGEEFSGMPLDPAILKAAMIRTEHSSNPAQAPVIDVDAEPGELPPAGIAVPGQKRKREDPAESDWDVPSQDSGLKHLKLELECPPPPLIVSHASSFDQILWSNCDEVKTSLENLSSHLNYYYYFDLPNWFRPEMSTISLHVNYVFHMLNQIQQFRSAGMIGNQVIGEGGGEEQTILALEYPVVQTEQDSNNDVGMETEICSHNAKLPNN